MSANAEIHPVLSGVIQDEARQLVHEVVSRQQPIYTLCQYIPPREWVCIESELEKRDFYCVA